MASTEFNAFLREQMRRMAAGSERTEVLLKELREFARRESDVEDRYIAEGDSVFFLIAAGEEALAASVARELAESGCHCPLIAGTVAKLFVLLERGHDEALLLVQSGLAAAAEIEDLPERYRITTQLRATAVMLEAVKAPDSESAKQAVRDLSDLLSGRYGDYGAELTTALERMAAANALPWEASGVLGVLWQSYALQLRQKNEGSTVKKAKDVTYLASEHAKIEHLLSIVPPDARKKRARELMRRSEGGGEELPKGG